MLKTMMAALYLLTIPGPAAWAQTARMANAPAAPLSPVVALSAFSAPVGAPALMSAPALTAAGLTAPSAFTAPALAAAAAASLPARAASPAAAAAAPAPLLAAAIPAAPAPGSAAWLDGVADRLQSAIVRIDARVRAGAEPSAIEDLRTALRGDFDGAIAVLGDVTAPEARAEIKELRRQRASALRSLKKAGPDARGEILRGLADLSASLSSAQVRTAFGHLSPSSKLRSDAAKRNAALWTLAGARHSAIASAEYAAAVAPEAPAETAPAPAPAPAPVAPASPRLMGYLGGTFGAQLASNALQVTMPLLFLNMTGSAATAAFAVTVGSAFDAAGTLVGGWLTDRVRAKPVLLGTTVARGLAMAVLPVLALTGGLTLPAVAAAYLVECFARGIADTARSTLPSELSGRDDGLLKKILAKNQSFFEAGGVAGPFIAGALIAGLGGVASAAALWLAPVAFAAVALAYLAIPKTASVSAPAESLPAPPAKTFDGWMRWALVATALLTLYPLKGLLPAIFATQVLNDPASAAWLVGLFGVGGFLGSLTYGRWNKSVSSRRWLLAGAAGTLALAVAFLPGAFLPAALGVLAFAGTNVAARLALNASIQTGAAPGQAGKAMGAARFTANLTGLGVRFLAGLAFTAAVAPSLSFWLVGGGVAAVGATIALMAGRLETHASTGPRPSAVHGRPGRLIVVEGLDGSGKSTQMERLKEELEAKGLKVVTTSWNSSDVVSEAVKKAKKDQTLNPKTFALMNAADLADRLEKVILPALDSGAIVLADRWFFTALARDSVRGNDGRWLRKLYADVPRPDLTLYFRLPVETAIGRVLKRSDAKLGLSEDHENPSGLKYYEAGLDAKLSDDPVENFRLFQTRVTKSYDAQAREFGFKVIDSSRDRDAITPDVTNAVFETLGPLSSFRKSDDPLAKTNIFDKDPQGDADNIRRNYMHEKRGVHFFFRNALLPMQDRFAQLMDMSKMPRVFLHGSPHMDNYAKNQNGAAMVDFDRSRVGPYAWDLVRLMVSISLRRKKDHEGLLDPDVLKQLKKGYLRGFRHPDRPFSEVRELKDVEPEKAEVSTSAYLKAGGKWAAEMRANKLKTDDPDIVALIDGYAKTQEPGFLDDYFIEEAGRGQGSMGFRGLFLVVMAPKDKKSGKDRILLNIKQTRKDPDTEWYKNPYPTEVERMHAASELYAPGWATRMGSATLGGAEYDVRQVQPQNVKIKKMMNHEQQMDFAYAVGTQLGRAHRLSLQDGTASQFEATFDAQFDAVVAAGLTIRDEIVEAHARYLRRMKRDGLEPHGDGDDE